jgi:hypothetical protein
MREIEQATATRPEMDYSLFIMVVVLVMLERFEKRPRATLAAFPPPIFTATATISLFHVSLLSPCENASGVFI